MNPQPPPVPPDDVPSSPPPPLSPQPPPYNGPPVVPPASSAPTALKIIGIGCGVLALIGVIAAVSLTIWGVGKAKKFAENPEQTIAEIVARAHPELEFVKSDPATRTVTIRSRDTGEEMKMSFDDIKAGKFRMAKSDGSSVEITPEGLKITDTGGAVTTVGASGSAAPPPAWLPLHPRAGEVRLSTRTEKAGGATGIYIFVTEDSVPVAVSTYRAILEEEFSAISSREISINGVERGEFSGEKVASGGGRQKFRGNAVRMENQTVISLEYEETAP